MLSKYIKCGCLMASVFAIQACIVPVPAPTRTSAPPSLKNKIDTQFIAVGHTTRQQVQEKLGWSAVGVGEGKVFWGRWSISSSAMVWAIGGYGAGAAGGNRNWSVKNILVVFDDDGVVRSSRIVSDYDIVQALRPLLTAGTRRSVASLGLVLDHVHHNKRDPVTLELSRTEIKYDEPDANKGKGRVFRISPQKLTAVTIPTVRKADSENPDEIWFTLHFSEKTLAGQNVTFAGGPDDLATLLRYHEEVSQSGVSKHK